MEVHNVTKDKDYIITAKTDTTVQDVESGYVLGVILAETQGRVRALSDQFSTEGECIVRPFR